MGWTEEQLQAINKRGANILVSAAAGSGKTSVLVERIITKVIEDKVDVDKILVVTFTSAAASEMKQRLLKALYKKIGEKPDDAYLQRQISLLNRANISTIHSFCLNMVKNNFYLLKMPANFRIGDTAEIEILKQEVIESIFEEKYENNDKEFLDLIRKYTTYSDDQNLKDLIIKIYEYSRCTPNPKKWIRESAEDFNFEEKIKNEDYSNKWTDILYQDLKETIIDSIEQLKKNKLKVEGIQALEKVYDIYEEDIQSLEKIDTTTWDTMITGIKNKTWTRYVGNIKASEGEKAIKSDLGEIRKNIKSKLTNIEFLSQKDAVLELNQMYPTLKYLANIIEEFDSRYTEAKHEKNIIDYSDLEHLSLKLLVDENNKKTEIANKYQFDEVLIDEYQDINEVQEKILTSVSNGKNTFMVGDVKQSIYRFRQSRPNIFIDKYINYKKAQKNDDKLEESTKILLYKNFRSRLEVLETTNIIFQSIMSKEFGEIEYNEEEYLNQGAEFEKNKLEDYSSELYIIDKNEEKIDGEIEEKTETEEDGNEDKEIIENSAYEARLIAEKIKEFHKQGYDYRDMAILLRSVKSSAPVYEKELSERGIPVYSDAASEYIDSIEINTIISFLKIIDNPLQDIPLITVLRSPIIGLNDNELLEIRLLDKERKFYRALELSKNEKAIRFIEMLNKFKKDSLSMPLDELIWKIYMETGYFYYVRLMPGGKTRQANLKKLFETAKNYEQISFKGLFNFILFIEKITKTKNEFESAKVVGEKDDVVKIMSIHKSKGLEFPIVFVSGITKRVNESDYRTKIAYDQDLGFGIKYIDEISEYDTISKRALKIKSFKEMLAEEMRILYVALTRAKEKLVLVGVERNAQKTKDDLANALSQYEHINNKINPSLVAKYKRMYEWIELSRIFNPTIPLKEYTVPAEKYKNMKIEEDETFDLSEYVKAQTPNEEAYKRIDQMLNWQYSHQASIDEITKTSVTALKNNNNKKLEIKKLITDDKTDKLTPAQIGTLVHLAMQQLKDSDIDKMLENIKISAIEKQELIKRKQIFENYIKSDLFKMLQEAKEVNRETPFFMYIDSENKEDKILVQGVIDLYFIDSNGNINLVDYKTDYAEKEEELVEKYKMQLSLYSKALSKSMKKEVTNKFIYSTKFNKIIKITEE